MLRSSIFRRSRVHAEARLTLWSQGHLADGPGFFIRNVGCEEWRTFGAAGALPVAPDGASDEFAIEPAFGGEEGEEGFGEARQGDAVLPAQGAMEVVGEIPEGPEG